MNRDRPQDRTDTGHAPHKHADRDARLAAALRENLARRKAQSRARKASPQSDDPAED